MAKTIKDLTIGDGYIYLMENNVKTKFYVLCHNYESDLNGIGRTLFCRESPATNGIRCQIGSSYSLGWGTVNYGGRTIYNEIYSYLVDTYPSNFTSTVKKWIATTRYKAYSPPNYWSSPSYFDLETFDTAFFTISEAEAVVNATHSDGSLLSKAARTRLERIFTAYGTGIWTRTHSNVDSGHEDDDDGSRDYYYANGLYLSGVSDSEWGVFSTRYAYNASYGYLPCFTLPETLYVYDDFTVSDTPQPTTFGYIGVNGVAREIKKAYIGVNGVAREIKKAYIGVNGVARLCQGYNQTKIVTAYNPSTGEIPAWDAAPSHAKFSMPLTAKKSGLLLRSISYRIKGFVAGKARVILRRYGSTTPLVDLSLKLIRGYNDVVLDMGGFPLEKGVEYQLYLSAVNKFYPPSVEAEWVVENDLIDIAHGSSYYEDNPKIIFAGTIVLSGAN